MIIIWSLINIQHSSLSLLLLLRPLFDTGGIKEERLEEEYRQEGSRTLVIVMSQDKAGGGGERRNYVICIANKERANIRNAAAMAF